MSAIEESIKREEVSRQRSVPVVNQILDFLSSVRFGVVLLCLLVFLSVLGMVIIQQNVQGFDAYFASKTPAERTVFGVLGLFDVYHSWYYNGLLLILSLNIVLASIDRIPGAWKYISSPKLTATRGWLLNQPVKETVTLHARSREDLADRILQTFNSFGFKSRIAESTSTEYVVDAEGRKDFSNKITKTNRFVFGESGRWNRMGAYIVHVFLLTLFLGHFVANKTGFDADIRLTPDTNAVTLKDFDVAQQTSSIQMIEINLDKQERYNVQLPFTITCTEIEQKLIDPNGTIEINNTLDWRTQIRIDDPVYGTTLADVSLNKPYNYRGYRFFQASAITVGSASEMTLELRPETAGAQPIKVQLKRNETATLPDGTTVAYANFTPDFVMKGGQPSTKSGDYNNPAVILDVTPPNGEPVKVYAFANKLPDNAPIAAPKAGYRWHLASFEKSPLAHVLSIKYDPYSGAFIAWYVGGVGLMGALVFVFFISHKRVWAMIDERPDGRFEVVFAGHANRSQLNFEEKFKALVSSFDSERVGKKGNGVV